MGFLDRDLIELNVLASGSDGNCSVLRADGTSIMIDAGLSGRSIVKLASRAGIDIDNVSALLLTHEHSDHVRGAGILSRRFGIPVYANANTFGASRMGKVDSWVEFRTLSHFHLGEVDVMPIPISHHAADPNAFSFQFENHRCLVATDIGKVTPVLQHEIDRSDLVMLEANHDLDMLRNGDYPRFLKSLIMGEKGHLSNGDCARALGHAMDMPRSVFLAHLSRNNNRPEVARQTVSSVLGCPADELLCLEARGEVCSLSPP